MTFQNPWIAANTLTTRYGIAIRCRQTTRRRILTLSGGVGLPFNSRYMGTLQYSMMTQDDAFMTSTINPLVAPAVLSRSSLNGDARTTLFNNVLNTQITPESKSTLRYRYYDYHSNQAPMTITGLVYKSRYQRYRHERETAFPVNFNKQNASAELVLPPLEMAECRRRL